MRQTSSAGASGRPPTSTRSGRSRSTSSSASRPASAPRTAKPSLTRCRSRNSRVPGSASASSSACDMETEASFGLHAAPDVLSRGTAPRFLQRAEVEGHVVVDDADRGGAVVPPVRPEAVAPDEICLELGPPALDQAEALLEIGVDVRKVIEEQGRARGSAEALLGVAPVEGSEESLHRPVGTLALLHAEPRVELVIRQLVVRIRERERQTCGLQPRQHALEPDEKPLRVELVGALVQPAVLPRGGDELVATAQSRPERMTPHNSHRPRNPERTKPMNERKFTPAICGPLVEKMPIKLEPMRPPTTISATTRRLSAASSLRMNSSTPLCTNPISICPSRASSRRSCTWYGISRTIRASSIPSDCARFKTRCGV